MKIIFRTGRIRLRANQGFTLIELIIVIAIIGILAAIAIPQLASYRRNAFDSQMLFDLRNAATAQEEYFVATGQYTSSIAALNASGFKNSANVTLTMTAIVGPPPSYTITAVHSNCATGSSRNIDSTNYSIGGPGCQ